MDIETTKKRINELLQEAREAAKRPDAYGLLPDVIRIMEMLQHKLESDSPDLEAIVRGAGALGRVVTDSYSFSESPLGSKLLDFVNEIISQYGY
ncbi:hypothetical protein [Thermoflexus sp.]|uniref:hypothetical protein n=1 Tax=Thermoflexus sp. TaxID=1969742 RepID=UPI0017E36EC9|nr:hypothetical protein [Thermoflexus sp.]